MILRLEQQLATFTETLRTIGRELDETRAVATREKERVRTLEIQLREQAEDHERALGEERERAANDQDAQVSSIQASVFSFLDCIEC